MKKNKREVDVAVEDVVEKLMEYTVTFVLAVLSQDI